MGDLIAEGRGNGKVSFIEKKLSVWIFLTSVAIAIPLHVNLLPVGQ